MAVESCSATTTSASPPACCCLSASSPVSAHLVQTQLVCLCMCECELSCLCCVLRSSSTRTFSISIECGICASSPTKNTHVALPNWVLACQLVHWARSRSIISASKKPSLQWLVCSTSCATSLTDTRSASSSSSIDTTLWSLLLYCQLTPFSEQLCTSASQVFWWSFSLSTDSTYLCSCTRVTAID